MPIVCGTDFSPAALAAAAAAAALAARQGVELRLVHVLTGFQDERLVGDERAPWLAPVRERLEHEAERLRASGARVEPRLEAGAPDQVLTLVAEEIGASLLVVGPVGRGGAARLFLGSTAERIPQSAPCPVLVLRGDDVLGPWLRGERKLRILLGADSSGTTEAAIRWLARLCATGACEVHAIQVVWPPEAHGRLGLQGSTDLEGLDPEAEGLITRELRRRLQPLEGKADLRVEARSGLGNPGSHLVQLAERLQADLLVVGTHQRRFLDRLRHGSVSSSVLHRATMSVVCVPPPGGCEEALGPVPRIRRVLAPTDFSAHGDRATRLAYASLREGGVVRLVHVVERAVGNTDHPHKGGGRDPKGDREQAIAALSEQLRSLVPVEADERGIRTEIEVVESRDAAAAIYQASERFDADQICMGSHGRTGMASAVLGSVAQGVFARTRRPVLLVRPRE